MDQIEEMFAEIGHAFSAENGEEVNHAHAQPVADIAGDRIAL
jgi:hypothetical protein